MTNPRGGQAGVTDPSSGSMCAMHWIRSLWVAGVFACVVVCVGCTDDQPTIGASIATQGTDDPAQVRLTEGGACGDAFFWAATKSGDTAVTVTITGKPRSFVTRSVFDLTEYNVDLYVSVLRGEQLARNFCTDVIMRNWQPTSSQPAVTGTGEIVLGPASAHVGQGCGTTRGTLQLDGLVAEDGTAFVPIKVVSQNIGCYSG